MHDRDCLHRFLFEHYPIRGQLVHLDASWRALLEHRNYPDAVRDTLGEAVAASVLLAATLKFEGVLSMQLQGQGPLHLLLAQCTSGLSVRALARHRESIETHDFMALSGEGTLTVTLETDDLSQRYQGVVPLEGERLAQCLQGYFENSEQLPTRLWLNADRDGASGMLLQRLPNESMLQRPQHGASTAARSSDDIGDVWRRVQLIGDTLKPEELRALTDAQILHRLFNEDDVRLFESSPVSFRCRCSHERVSAMLQSLGEEEVTSILKERGNVEVHCDFCNRAYVFDAVDATRLFAAGAAVNSSRVH